MQQFLLLLFSVLFIGSVINSQAQVKRFTILHTNDEHSTLLPVPLVDYAPDKPNPTLGGFARLATKVSEIRENKASVHEPVLLLSAGDIIGGSPFAWLILNQEAPEIKLMHHIGYDLMTIGNYEFDYGPDIFASYLTLAGYPDSHSKMEVISSNIEIPDGHALHDAEIGRTSVFELENGLKIGVFGLLGKDAVSVAPLAEPITFREQHETAREMVQQLTELGVDVIVAVTHSGVPEDIDLANDVPGIDIIIGGHDHVTLETPLVVNGTIIAQTGYYLRNLGKLEFEFDTDSKTLRLVNESNGNPYLIPLDSSVKEDSVVAEMVHSYTKKLNEFIDLLTQGRFQDISEHIAFSSQPLIHGPAFRETAVGNLATDAMRLVTENVTGKRVDFAFQGNGVLRADVDPGTMEWSKDAISFLDFATIAGLGTGPDLLPGYPIVSVYLTGEEIHRVLEISALLSQFLGNTYFLQVSGLRFEVDPERSILFRIPFSGTPIPTFRAVFNAELFKGDGIQNEQGPWQTLPKKDDTLYHVVSDYYVASFLPMIGDLLPSLQLVLKNEKGEPISHIDDAIVFRGDYELKVWHTLVEFLAELPKVDERPTIPASYFETGNRIIIKKGIPLLFWPILGVVGLTGLIFYIRHRRKKR
jgi:5'-nucleotidase/UDP-sugar diphosphatase